jgi:hypothetical protein
MKVDTGGKFIENEINSSVTTLKVKDQSLVLIQKFIIFTKDSNSKILRIRRIINIQ